MAELTENLLKLKQAYGVGNLILWRLLKQFGDADRILGATERELAEIEGVSKDKARAILKTAEWDARPEMEKAALAGIDIIPYDDAGYPQPLLHTFDPPAVLYMRGKLTAEDQVAVGIVGTRHASRYGREQAETLAGGLARAGYTVVSGLARGIDTWAHCGALDAGGRTVGVLGCGFDHMYPEENRDLALEISRSGAVITEFPMATSPSRETFPARNRIIAGMSLGVLVIEAPKRSGSLITARQANDIGRTVFAIPGRVGDANSEGCNKLIAAGAVMVTTLDDMLEELNPSVSPPPLPDRKPRKTGKSVSGRLFITHAEGDAAPAPPSRPPTMANDLPRAGKIAAATAPRTAPQPSAPLSSEQTAILAAVGTDWTTIDDITQSVDLPAGKVAAALAMLKMKRLVDQGPGQTYRQKIVGA